MDKKILVTYTTLSGSTAEVAEAVAEELKGCGAAVDVLPMAQVTDLAPYSAVVAGGPMVMGWHREAVKFVKAHRQELGRVPVAYFITGMSLTDTGTTQVSGAPVTIDPELAKAPKKPGKLSFTERYATAENYLGEALKAAPGARPVSAAIFGGKMDYTRLKLFQMLFVMLIIRAQPGDRRNWPVIRSWAASLYPALVR
jgi:menaquinone-dependent protoporphyrinogen IX oxidase